MPILLRSSAANRSITRLFSSTEMRQHVPAGPRVAVVVPGGQPSLGEVDRHPRRPGRERLPDVLLASSTRSASNSAWVYPGISSSSGYSNASIDGAITACFIGRWAIGKRLVERVGGVGLVRGRAAGEPGQLPVVTVGEDGEVLPAGPGQMIGQPGACQRVGDRVGGEARPPLLAVGDDRLAGRLQVLDRIRDRLVLLGFQLVVGDLPGVVAAVRLLQPARAGQQPTGSVGIPVAVLGS